MYADKSSQQLSKRGHMNNTTTFSCAHPREDRHTCLSGSGPPVVHPSTSVFQNTKQKTGTHYV